ncbi:tail collar domain [Xenorhabdus cabanillasii]|uniref:Tail collar domain n=2 Tax=Xenorhabdus cabanillasii TaxID=351673 RepID=A0A3D9UUT3_9GAMM|nr:tail collar domain [Xenorhabdus cabanillasii]
MAKNEFLPFGIADGANVLTNDEYSKLAARTDGFSSGVAKSQELNKVWRQSAAIATVVAQFIAETTDKDVLDDGNLQALQAGLLNALRTTINASVPAASLTTAGITKLSNATDSNAENVAATSKAVKAVYDLASNIHINEASITQKGIVQLNNATDSPNEAQAATPKAVKAANDNASRRLDKAQNGADIPDKAAFVRNIGLEKTVKQAQDAMAKSANGADIENKAHFVENVGAYPKTGGVVNGNVDAFGYISANGIYEAGGKRVYSPVNKPRIDDIVLGAWSVLPVGVPVPWPLETPPAGWLKCNGSTFVAGQYPELEKVYPSLRLPDLRGVFIRGWSDDGLIDAGRPLLSFSADTLKKHSHSLLFGYGNGHDTPAVHEEYRKSASSVSYAAAGSSGLYISEEGGNETAPCNIAFNYIVRAI